MLLNLSLKLTFEGFKDAKNGALGNVYYPVRDEL